MNTKHVLAIVPARGGSKGIPRKNIRPLAGKPLICHTIQCARQAVSVTRVIVSTDDKEIAAVAAKAGAEVPFLRSAALARDDTPIIDVIIDVLQRLDSTDTWPLISVLQPTSPLRLPQDIDETVRLMDEKEFDSVSSFCQSPHPAEYLYRIDTGRTARAIFTEDENFIRQDMEPAYLMNGAVYVVKREIVLQKRSLFGTRLGAYIMPEERSVDIDTPLDLDWAEFLLTRRN